ncbi:MAG: 23S rRNA (adenine(2503)-C(2))-methyltransferase RlmN [Bacteroidales bacterium]|nr:23S rRNA (adenine(2503)-C(2))-methyltransferase RlmN [Bacteroidales bacterium]
MVKTKLLGKNPDELSALAVDCGLKPFVGRQLAEWLYVKRVSDWSGMSNISKDSKARLQEKYDLGTSAPIGSARSSDGTVKYLFKVGENEAVEAVLIPDEDRKTLCVSSQAGCKMGCRFCMTGRQGWHGNLDAADILNQFISIPEAGELTNAVFMGMGEPLDNYDAVSRAIDILTDGKGFGWSPKRITLSTIGVLPVLKRFLDEHRCHLAISLHNPFPDERLEMMPVQKAWPLEDVVALLRQYDFSGQRRVSFEYTMFAGWNDDKRHADALIRLLGGLECRVNLIRFHKIPDFPYDCAPAVRMEEFRDRLNKHGLVCTIRASRGEDILAACGMLAGQRSQQ